ncbi:MAG TPA: DUF5615 family PIN-like protein [Gemmataceae bacterium]
MIRLLADENLNGSIVRGLTLHRPDVDLVRVQDAGLSGADDPSVLAWAAEHGRVVLSHDAKDHSQIRLRAGGSGIAHARGVHHRSGLTRGEGDR